MTRLVEFLGQEREALVGYVRRRIDDAADHEAEDIVQDVVVHLFDRADPSIPIQNLAAYIYRALRNRIVDYFRRRRETLVLSEAAVESRQNPASELEREEMLDDVFAAMEELSAEEKAIILATEMEGRTFKELAEEWGIPLGTLLGPGTEKNGGISGSTGRMKAGPPSNPMSREWKLRKKRILRRSLGDFPALLSLPAASWPALRHLERDLTSDHAAIYYP